MAHALKSWFNSSRNKHLKLIEYMYDMLMKNNKESANLSSETLQTNLLLTIIFAHLPNRLTYLKALLYIQKQIVSKFEKSWLTEAI